jgi:hypothetical protein
MSSSTKPSPEITRAAERYLEQYGDPLVMNTYLKVNGSVAGINEKHGCRFPWG